MVRAVILALAIAIAPALGQSYSYGEPGSYGYGQPPPTQEVIPAVPPPPFSEVQSNMPGCLIDHGEGCEECDYKNKMFKVNDGDGVIRCQPCDATIGPNCLFCQDFLGCAQCVNVEQFVLDNKPFDVEFQGGFPSVTTDLQFCVAKDSV